ncbi:lipopolysaccharide biosynthesis protein [Sphingobacterium corticibacter]|uniref:Lipopolysaccharide biosynthesis protein n=1 Tax=Sphingobacterium corticibacter TaxID=2171749 RepID=A0A2T8HJI0_9SPHI|nr:lipopolysaccharide biosynthesis protein [Sphingobacterium corticibacter]PVH25616.1 lipopolysaccharide biosynthesis protein [Sphingobacterium corticibacter]
MVNKNTDEVSLRKLISSIAVWYRYLLSKWYIFLGAALLGGGVGYIYAKSIDPSYTATTTFVLETNDGGGLSQYAGMAAMMGLNIGGSGSGGGIFQGNNIQALYKSRAMLEKALLSKTYSDSSELLIERFITFSEMREQWRKKRKEQLLALDFNVDRSALTVSTLRLRDSVLGSVTDAINSKMLTVGTENKKSTIYKVDVSSPDEIFSKTFNEALVGHVNEFYIQTKTIKSLKTIDILQEKVDSVRAIMTGSINRAANVIDATPNINPTRQARQRIVPSQQAQFSTETNKAILGQLVQNLELSKMNQLQEQPLIQVVDEPIYPLEKSRLGKAKAITIGGFISLFLALGALVCTRLFHLVMEEENL